MKRWIKRTAYILVFSCVLSGCISKDEFFSKNGRYIVEGINASSRNYVFQEEYSFDDNGDYYFADLNAGICKYSSEKGEVEVILNHGGILQSFFVCDNYIYSDNGYIYRYDMETGENICILDYRDVNYVAMQVRDGYIYIYCKIMTMSIDGRFMELLRMIENIWEIIFRKIIKPERRYRLQWMDC